MEYMSRIYLADKIICAVGGFMINISVAKNGTLVRCSTASAEHVATGSCFHQVFNILECDK